jgi:hypothetical protein
MNNILAIQDERGSGNGCFVYLNPGWAINDANTNSAQHDFGEDTRAAALRTARNAKQCACAQCLAGIAQLARSAQYTIGSSHGELTINAEGTVIDRRLDNADPDGGEHLARITRFDLEEWRRLRGNPEVGHIDILDLGYWYIDADGKKAYAPPDEKWRSEIAESLLGRRAGAGAA